jgi:hypothetical protein
LLQLLVSDDAITGNSIDELDGDSRSINEVDEDGDAAAIDRHDSTGRGMIYKYHPDISFPETLLYVLKVHKRERFIGCKLKRERHRMWS